MADAIAIIPARGGSKRIPGKNSRDFLGKPILVYSIEAALQSGAFQEVMVSTDDEKIAALARDHGASVPFLRSAKTSDDHATTAAVLEEVLNEYLHRDRHFHLFCCIYPTAPFVTAQKIRDARDLMLASGHHALVTIVRFGYPIQRAFTLREGRLAFAEPEFASTRSQDLEARYHDAGQMYWRVVEDFMRTRSLLAEDTAGFEVKEWEAQDIDTPEDWLLAEWKYEHAQRLGLLDGPR